MGGGDSYADAVTPILQATGGDVQNPLDILLHHGVKYQSQSSYGPSHHPNQVDRGVAGTEKGERFL